MTPELLKEAISRLDGLAPDRLDYTLGLKSWYLVIQRDIMDDEYFFMDVGERPTSRVLLPVLYPWERTRALRHLRYDLRETLERVELLADSFADSNAPPLEPAWAPDTIEELRNDGFEQLLMLYGGSPLWVSQVQLLQNFESAIRVAQTELAVEAWRLAHDGKLPESLDQLVGVYLKLRPVNPVTKKPFRLEPGARTDGEYAITTGEAVDGRR
jgi:hypothetical protein